jgi:hypothetical protein
MKALRSKRGAGRLLCGKVVEIYWVRIGRSIRKGAESDAWRAEEKRGIGRAIVVARA